MLLGVSGILLLLALLLTVAALAKNNFQFLAVAVLLVIVDLFITIGARVAGIR